jgi:hypothetical protein
VRVLPSLLLLGLLRGAKSMVVRRLDTGRSAGHIARVTGLLCRSGLLRNFLSATGTHCSLVHGLERIVIRHIILVVHALVLLPSLDANHSHLHL